MKKIALLVLISTAIIAAPDWYGKLTVEASGELIGYGDGSSMDEAKSAAKSDIAHSIASRISSSITSSTTVNNKSVSSKSAQKIEDKSDVTLSGTKLLKSENEGGRYFVALSYDNRPFEEKIFSALGKKLCSPPHPYLSHTELLKRLEARAECKSTNIQISRENGIWYAGKDEIRLPLPAVIMDELMQKLSSGSILLDVAGAKSFVKDGESFKLALGELPKTGYLSLFDLYNNGRVVVIEKNINLSKLAKTEIIYPDNIRSDIDLTGGLLEPTRETRDLYVAIVSISPLDLSRFPRMDTDINKDELSFAFDKLLELMRTNQFATTLVTTRAK